MLDNVIIYILPLMVSEELPIPAVLLELEKVLLETDKPQ